MQRGPESERAQSRRDFCRSSLLVAAGTALVGCAGAPKGSASLDGSVLRVALADNPPLATPGGAVAVDAGEHKLLVVFVGEGRYLAGDRKCTHMGCPVDWDAEGQAYACPCHGSRFSPDGAVVHGPAKKPLRQYPVEAGEGELRISLG